MPKKTDYPHLAIRLFLSIGSFATALLHVPAAQGGPEQAVVAVCVQPRCDTGSCGGMIARGSGVAIGRDRETNRLMILTAAHVVRDRSPDSEVVVYVGKAWRKARVRAITRQTPDWDLALLELDYAGDWPCLNLLQSEPGSGSEVTLCGYEGGLRWVCKRGVFGRRDRNWFYWNGATPREGTSGGALVANGCLIAIISGYTNDGAQLGVGQSSSAIALFLQNALGYVPGESEPPPAAQPPAVAQPLPAPPQTNAALAGLQAQVASLKQELQAVKDRPIKVEIFDPETGNVKSRSFPAGEPIRLKLPARRESNVGTS